MVIFACNREGISAIQNNIVRFGVRINKDTDEVDMQLMISFDIMFSI